ncbi:MAG: NTP transferase domain-containing protein [Clostridiales bacterium]|nr:NTP transferase domain-containing protein [Clostridiales bacterium]
MNLFSFKHKNINCSAVVVAAGNSVRFGEDKIFALLSGIPVLAYSLATLESCEYVSEIVVVADCAKITEVAALCEKYNISKVSKVVCGGATRLESALSGISETDKRSCLIAVHDGARPLVTKNIIENTIECAMKHKAASPGVPAKDTVKIVSNSFVSETPERSRVYSIQTPQGFVP